MHLQHRDFFGNSTNMVFEVYYEPTITVGANPTQVLPRPFDWADDTEISTAAIDIVESFTGGSLACRNKVYGAEGVGNQVSGGTDTTSLEINFPANSVVGVKIYRSSGTGAANCIFRSAWYESGPVVEV